MLPTLASAQFSLLYVKKLTLNNLRKYQNASRSAFSNKQWHQRFFPSLLTIYIKTKKHVIDIIVRKLETTIGNYEVNFKESK